MRPEDLNAAAVPTKAFHGSPAQEPERYVSRHELARMMGVSIATIDRLVAEGMPSVTWGRRMRRFQPSVAMAWARSQRRVA